MKEYHHGNLHQALIASTLVLLKTKTSRELSLRQVARQAGVSHAAPYRHFKDKADLFAAVAKSVLIELDTYIEDSISQIDENPAKRLRILSMTYIRYALKHPQKYQLLFGNDSLGNLKLFSNQDVQLSDDSKLISYRTLQILIEIIATGQTTGQFKAGNAKTIALGIWAFVHGLTMLLLQGQLCLEEAEALALSMNMAENIAGIQI